MKRLLCSAFVIAMVSTTALAKPPLRDVAEIDDTIMYVAIADEIRKSCDDISARLVRAYSTINSLKSIARQKGYTEEEVEDYVTSKAEKKRMRAKAEGFLAQNGVVVSDKAALCKYGKSEIRAQSQIGRLLK